MIVSDGLLNALSIRVRVIYNNLINHLCEDFVCIDSHNITTTRHRSKQASDDFYIRSCPLKIRNISKDTLNSKDPTMPIWHVLHSDIIFTDPREKAELVKTIVGCK